MANNVRTNQARLTGELPSKRQLTLLAVAFPFAVADACHTKELYGGRKLIDVASARRNTYRLDLLDAQFVQLATTTFTEGSPCKI